MLDTKIWDFRNIDAHLPNNEEMQEIKTIYEEGGLIALPTETVYGLGGNAKDDKAVKAIYEAKGRPSDNPLIVHIHSMKQLDNFTENISAATLTLMRYFWPGPISFIVPLKAGYLCEHVSGGLASIAVRMPSHSVGRYILQQVDLPIAAPSANLSGRPSPTLFEHVYQDLNGRVDGIINGDQSEEGLESTVLDCTVFPFKIARPGSVTKQMIETIIPNSVEAYADFDSDKPIAPGMKYKHYAPDTPLTIIRNFNKVPTKLNDWNHTAFIVPENKKDLVPKAATFISLCADSEDLKEANHNLYSILHRLDNDANISQAYIYGFDDTEASHAYMNRLMKAANQQEKEGDEL